MEHDEQSPTIRWDKLALTALLLLIAVVVPLLIMEGLSPPSETLMWKAFFDAGHALLFGAQALVFLMISKRFFGRDWPWTRHYLLAFCLAVGVGIAGEATQLRSARQADVADVVTDGLGAVSFLLFASAFERRSSGRNRKLLPVLGFTTIALAFAPVTILAGGYVQRARQFPVLFDWHSSWQRPFVRVRRARWDMDDSLNRLGATDTSLTLVTFFPGRYSRVELREPYPDWRGYDRLVYDVSSKNSFPVKVLLRIEDFEHNQQSADRYEEIMIVQKGTHRVTVPLSRVQSAPETRPMDLSRIRRLALVVVDSEAPVSLSFSPIRLEADETFESHRDDSHGL